MCTVSLENNVCPSSKLLESKQGGTVPSVTQPDLQQGACSHRSTSLACEVTRGETQLHFASQKSTSHQTKTRVETRPLVAARRRTQQRGPNKTPAYKRGFRILLRQWEGKTHSSRPQRPTAAAVQLSFEASRTRLLPRVTRASFLPQARAASR